MKQQLAFFVILDDLLNDPESLVNKYSPVGLIVSWDLYSQLQMSYSAGLFKPDRCETLGKEGMAPPLHWITSYRGLKLHVLVGHERTFGFVNKKGEVGIQPGPNSNKEALMTDIEQILDMGVRRMPITSAHKNPGNPRWN